MSKVEISKRGESSRPTAPNRLFVLDASGGRIFTVNPDGSNQINIVTNCRLPDGVALDVEAGHMYWTNMGVPYLNDGSIERADLDGKNRKVIVSEGRTFTPKQLHLDKKNGKLYWSDRGGNARHARERRRLEYRNTCGHKRGGRTPRTKTS